MLKENIEIVKNTFQEYQGNGMYLALFFIAMLYIYLKEEDKKKKNLFLYFPILVLVVTLNPLFNKIVGKIFGGLLVVMGLWQIIYQLKMRNFSQ